MQAAQMAACVTPGEEEEQGGLSEQHSLRYSFFKHELFIYMYIKSIHKHLPIKYLYITKFIVLTILKCVISSY